MISHPLYQCLSGYFSRNQQHVILRMSVILRIFLKVQICGCHPDPSESEFPGMGLRSLNFSKCFRRFLCALKVRAVQTCWGSSSSHCRGVTVPGFSYLLPISSPVPSHFVSCNTQACSGCAEASDRHCVCCHLSPVLRVLPSSLTLPTPWGLPHAKQTNPFLLTPLPHDNTFQAAL